MAKYEWIKLDREELYRQIWSVPPSKVGGALWPDGYSDSKAV